jgi:hypothetical protein
VVDLLQLNKMHPRGEILQDTKKSEEKKEELIAGLFS